MKKAIITGANGFIGSALCRELSSRGISVIAVVRDETSMADQIRNLPGLVLVYCEMSEICELPKRVSDRDIDVFYHLAWTGSAGALRSNREVQIDNIRYTCDAADICSELGCKKFVFASSIMEYEIGAVMETENTPSITTLYSSAKTAADYMARTVAGNMKVDYIRAVISNIYGPGEKSVRLINASLRKLLNKEHCAFSSGEQMYDFIYIDDAAKAFAEIGEKGKANKTYYIGSRSPRPLKDFLCRMRDQIDPLREIGLGEIASNGISLTYEEFDIHAVEKDTGFVPSVSFEEGIQNTIKWLEESGN